MSNDLFATKLAALQRGEWINPPVAIVPTWNAFIELRHSDCCLMKVTWWGSEDKPLPAGYTRFNFPKTNPEVDDGREYFDIVIYEEGTGWNLEMLHRNDAVLVFPSSFNVLESDKP